MSSPPSLPPSPEPEEIIETSTAQSSCLVASLQIPMPTASSDVEKSAASGDDLPTVLETSPISTDLIPGQLPHRIVTD